MRKNSKEVVTLKKRLGAFLLFTFLLGGGTIFANGSPGQNLADWYEDSFLVESEKLGVATVTGLREAIKEVNSFLGESQQHIDDTLAIFRNDKVKEAEVGIKEYQAKTIKSLHDTVAELENVNFAQYVDELNMEAEIEADLDKMVEEIFSE